MKKFLNRITFFGGGLLAAYIGLVRPWISRWNATDDELLGVQLGDELISHPLLHTTRSVLIQAPAKKVWPWVVQIGYGRGGFYSYDQLEQAAGLEGLRSAASIDPALQGLKKGDTIHISPVTPMTVAVFKPNRAMVLHTLMSPFTAQTLDPHNPTQPWIDWTWSFLVTPLNDYACRLASRVRAVYAPYFLLWPLVALGIEPAAFVMDRKMLLTIKERAESMKAVRLVQPGQPLALFDIPIPAAGPDDVLVRVRAAGICHSDVHYRAGRSPVFPLPLTLGHEVAGVVEQVGARVRRLKPGDRVVLHYLVTCGACIYCAGGSEQFCAEGKMLGHHTDGGFAEFIAVPERNALILPDEVPFEGGATLMCASATALHALRKGRLKGGETLAVIGVGGLGLSAVQLGRALGAREVYAVEPQPAKRALAVRYGALPVDPAQGDPADQIRQMTSGRGVDVSLELIGLPLTMHQALRCVAPMGRAVVVGLCDRPLEIDTYRELLGPEAELIGSNDHLLHELPLLLEYARRGILDLSQVVSRTVPLEAAAVNTALDELERFSAGVRTVIVP